MERSEHGNDESDNRNAMNRRHVNVHGATPFVGWCCPLQSTVLEELALVFPDRFMIIISAGRFADHEKARPATTFAGRAVSAQGVPELTCAG
jgi:hypothetical protein